MVPHCQGRVQNLLKLEHSGVCLTLETAETRQERDRCRIWPLLSSPRQSPRNHHMQVATEGPRPLPPSNRGCLGVLGCITGTFLTYTFQQRLFEPSKPQPWPQNPNAAASITPSLAAIYDCLGVSSRHTQVTALRPSLWLHLRHPDRSDSNLQMLPSRPLALCSGGFHPLPHYTRKEACGPARSEGFRQHAKARLGVCLGCSGLATLPATPQVLGYL